MQNDMSSLQRQLSQLRELHDAGALPTAQYEQSKALLERRLLDAVLNEVSAGVATPLDEPGSVPPGQLQQTAQAEPAASHQSGALGASAPLRGHRVSKKFQAGLALGVVVLACVGYGWGGAPQFWSIGPSAAGQSAPAAAEQNTGLTETEQIAAMVERLAQRMKEQPQDAEGWAMLARSYTVLERHTDALTAYERAVALRADDPQLLADYADSLGVNNGHNLAGEPMKWVEKALKLDPANLKALALAGTEAFIRKDYALAVKHWERVAQLAPPDSSYAKQVQAGLDEARELGGLPAAPKTAEPVALVPPASAANATSTKAPGGVGSISGSVSLASSLAAQAGPEDTVFVFVRSASGDRMPLAVLRKKVKDLPFEFSFDDSMAMSPAAKLSDAASVVVSARVSKTGEALPSSGDLSGQVGPVTLGATGIKLEIRDAVK